MAGANWHFYAANRTLERLKTSLASDSRFRCMVSHQNQFLAGVQGPDFNFYPGGNGQISKLAHGIHPADLGRSLLKHAQSEAERAFAYGWLMHLTTDTLTHPLVNQLILEHFPVQTRNGTDPKAYPLGHHRVEWGIDVDLLQNDEIKHYLPEMATTLSSALDLSPLAAKAFLEVSGFELRVKDWQGSIKGMIRFTSVFELAWALTGRIRDSGSIKQALKSVGYHLIVTPLAKVIALQNPENGAGVFIPIKPKQHDIKRVLEHAEKVCPVFEAYLDQDFSDLPNDTG